jgi:hypothetical protein
MSPLAFKSAARLAIKDINALGMGNPARILVRDFIVLAIVMMSG